MNQRTAVGYLLQQKSYIIPTELETVEHGVSPSMEAKYAQKYLVFI